MYMYVCVVHVDLAMVMHGEIFSVYQRETILESLQVHTYNDIKPTDFFNVP